MRGVTLVVPLSLLVATAAAAVTSDGETEHYLQNGEWRAVIPNAHCTEPNGGGGAPPTPNLHQ